MLVISANGSLGSIVVPWLTEETVTLHTALLDRQQVLCSSYCRSHFKTYVYWSEYSTSVLQLLLNIIGMFCMDLWEHY
ncbi:hypothetical protein Pcinc_014171 [Petrolisthes cinctipes]|uniref:Uncharacterized protein n=1 Tax=Petrolisthes cinctipes TaxID=88211 RepID=A0AAE1KTI7_PETCI|nr:hypothetical protein Pcinc_014171 [Petrolisthes cinctipes]